MKNSSQFPVQGERKTKVPLHHETGRNILKGMNKKLIRPSFRALDDNLQS